jgi:hypothetical protein
VFQNFLEATLKSALPAPIRLPALVAASHLLGTAITRYIIGVPVLVAPSLDELVSLVSPAIEKYLDTA